MTMNETERAVPDTEPVTLKRRMFIHIGASLKRSGAYQAGLDLQTAVGDLTADNWHDLVTYAHPNPWGTTLVREEARRLGYLM